MESVIHICQIHSHRLPTLQLNNSHSVTNNLAKLLLSIQKKWFNTHLYMHWYIIYSLFGKIDSSAIAFLTCLSVSHFSRVSIMSVLKHHHALITNVGFGSLGMGSAVSCKENMKGPLAWHAMRTDGWSSSDIQGEAPAEWVNHWSTNCSSQHVRRIKLSHSLFLWPGRNVVLCKINPYNYDDDGSATSRSRAEGFCHQWILEQVTSLILQSSEQCALNSKIFIKICRKLLLLQTRFHFSTEMISGGLLRVCMPENSSLSLQDTWLCISSFCHSESIATESKVHSEILIFYPDFKELPVKVRQHIIIIISCV